MTYQQLITLVGNCLCKAWFEAVIFNPIVGFEEGIDAQIIGAQAIMEV